MTAEKIPFQTLNQAIFQADTAQKAWREQPYTVRAAYLLRIAQAFEDSADELAELMAVEMHKPLSQGIAEAKKCAWVCRHFAQASEAYLTTESLDFEQFSADLVYEPVGIVFGIMPWNFPFWQVFRMAAPALMAGNAVLLKHAPETPFCAQKIQEIVDAAHLPAGLYTTLKIEIDAVESVIAHPLVRLVTLTGGEKAGRSVAALAGKYLKKCILELGGSDAFIVCATADITQAATVAAVSRTNNNGQACNVAKRFLVHQSVFEAFAAACIAQFDTIFDTKKDPKTAVLTELISPKIRDLLQNQYRDATTKGAKILYEKGGFESENNSAPLILFTDIQKNMLIYDGETFGTIATITPFTTDEQALFIANDTDLGLCATVFSKDTAQAKWFAHHLAVGMVAINQAVSSDPRLPFGGSKNSGFGRELGAAGIRELCNLKTITYPQKA
jgi:succinate-semialdehyde dehydrogenase / glutarate-semialdehyde dehydrogenase